MISSLQLTSGGGGLLLCSGLYSGQTNRSSTVEYSLRATAGGRWSRRRYAAGAISDVRTGQEVLSRLHCMSHFLCSSPRPGLLFCPSLPVRYGSYPSGTVGLSTAFRNGVSFEKTLDLHSPQWPQSTVRYIPFISDTGALCQRGQGLYMRGLLSGRHAITMQSGTTLARNGTKARQQMQIQKLGVTANLWR